MKELLAKRAQAIGQDPPTAYGVPGKKDKEEDDDDDRYQDPENESGLFAGINFDRDDDEADEIFAQVDEKMDRRRRARRSVPIFNFNHPNPYTSNIVDLSFLLDQITDVNRFHPYREGREQKEREEYERKNPKIQQQFADLKRALGTVTEDEWAALPEVGDMTGRTKRAREARQNNRFYAVPDSVIAGAASAGQLDTSISADAGNGTVTDFASIGAAQKSALQVRLDSAAQSAGSDSNSGTATSIDNVKGYLTSLEKSAVKASEVPVEDLNRARLLLESAVKTNPKNGPGHVALCRLEEFAGKVTRARKVIAQGADLCPRSIDVWLENIRINRENLQNSRIIAANALKIPGNSKSVELWQAALELESTPQTRKRVLRQAIDSVPSSVELWKLLINETEDIEEVRLLFYKATQTIPLSEELWISYARVSNPNEAQQILNTGRKAIKSSWAIWVAGARLQEQLGNKIDMVQKILERAVKSLAKEKAMLKREECIAEAEKCEEEGARVTCVAIINATLAWSLDEDDDRRDTWLKDAKASIGRGKYATARAIYAYGLRVFPTSKPMWHAACDLEKNHGTHTELIQALEKAVNAISGSSSESLWLMLVRERWNAEEFTEARITLNKAFTQLQGNENIYLRAVDLEVDAKQYAQAREFLEIGRNTTPTARIYLRSATLERNLGNIDAALDLTNMGLELFPGAWKLHAVKGQLYESMGQLPQAEQAYSQGTRVCPKDVELFLLLSRVLERQGHVVKARSALDRGKLANPKNAVLLCESVRLERRAGNIPAANKVMAQALQETGGHSGLLWAERIMHLEARTQRKPRALEAIKKIDNDPILFVVVARIFWGERRLEKAATWFEKALVLNSDYGDAWAWYYKFLEQHGTEEKKAEVLSKITLAEPKHGEVWQQVAKDPKNVGKNIEELLHLAVKQLE
jgi:pre-mRNA-processing factor 6